MTKLALSLSDRKAHRKPESKPGALRGFSHRDRTRSIVQVLDRAAELERQKPWDGIIDEARDPSLVAFRVRARLGEGRLPPYLCHFAQTAGCRGSLAAHRATALVWEFPQELRGIWTTRAKL